MTGDRIVPVIGLEIHAELATRSKLFCRCANAPGSPPNANVCPVCLGLPGALPVLNAEAVRLSVLAGLALACEVPAGAKWDRKSYYYPDLPKNYQISQYDLPLSRDGHLDVPLADGSAKRVGIIRAHLEEDAGKNVHDRSGCTGVDLNRAGVPLLEIVTRPDLSTAEETLAFAREVQRLLRWIGASGANMEQGQIRFEPNVNLHVTRDGRTYRTPITEVKNLNSFRSLEATVAFEIERQYELWCRDPEGFTMERSPRENRGFDVATGTTVFQRGKEEAHDYRYFPDPDLVPVTMDAAWVSSLRAGLGELPAACTARFRERYGLSAKDAALLSGDAATAKVLDGAVEAGAEPRRAAALLAGVGGRMANERGTPIGELGVTGSGLAELALLVDGGELTPTAANTVFGELVVSGGSARAVATSRGLLVTRDLELVASWVREAVDANPKAVDDVLQGGKNEKKAFGFLMGQVMQRSKGAASPAEVERLLRDALRGAARG
jgi:aspartyl-tRNA(Asn)/glutamyl-tRNA(Gln) amidotransferase subunit B